jgi:mannosyl-oligosaccharide alpha-1,2-mannosidase
MITPPFRRLVFYTALTLAIFYTLYHLDRLQSAWGSDPLVDEARPPPPHQVEWATVLEHFPVTSFIPLPTAKPTSIPTIQQKAQSESTPKKKERLERRDAVKQSFEHAWEGYKKYAWMEDEVAPISGTFITSFGGRAATLVDTLDTLWIMDLRTEFVEAVQALDDLDFSTSDAETMNIFETTIRYLGGLLGAYDISGGKYPRLLEKAVTLGDMMYKAFDTPNRMPKTRWLWKK